MYKQDRHERKTGSVLSLLCLHGSRDPVSVMHCWTYFWCAIIPIVHLIFRMIKAGYSCNLKWQWTHLEWCVVLRKLYKQKTAASLFHSKLSHLLFFDYGCDRHGEGLIRTVKSTFRELSWQTKRRWEGYTDSAPADTAPNWDTELISTTEAWEAQLRAMYRIDHCCWPVNTTFK